MAQRFVVTRWGVSITPHLVSRITCSNTFRSWCITWNSPTKTEQEVLDACSESQVRYLIFQREQGAGSEIQHYQLYAEFRRPVRHAYVKKLFDCQGLHLEKRYGTREQAKHYCEKTGCAACPTCKSLKMKCCRKAMKSGELILGTPYIFGDFSAGGAGTRNDISELLTLAKSSSTMLECFEQNPGLMIKHTRAFDRIRSLIKPPPRPHLKVTLIVGPTGCNKTRYVQSRYPECWGAPVGTSSSNGWFDGYDGQPIALLDDYAGELALKHLLKVLDIYPIQVPAKGNHLWYIPDQIFITSNECIDDWYDFSNREASRLALHRRFTKVITIPSDGTILTFDGELMPAMYAKRYVWPGDKPALFREDATVSEDYACHILQAMNEESDEQVDEMDESSATPLYLSDTENQDM